MHSLKSGKETDNFLTAANIIMYITQHPSMYPLLHFHTQKRFVLLLFLFAYFADR